MKGASVTDKNGNTVQSNGIGLPNWSVTFACSCAAGMAGVLVGNPFDVSLVRLQQNPTYSQYGAPGAI